MMNPGEYLFLEKEIVLNAKRKTAKVRVKNTAERPVQIGSHFHFFEVNRVLSFNREKAFGMRLDIPAGAAVRFEPGEEKQVNLVLIGGQKKVYGLNGLTNGHVVSEKVFKRALIRAKIKGYQGVK
jgi:urease beta subunit